MARLILLYQNIRRWIKRLKFIKFKYHVLFRKRSLVFGDIGDIHLHMANLAKS